MAPSMSLAPGTGGLAAGQRGCHGSVRVAVALGPAARQCFGWKNGDPANCGPISNSPAERDSCRATRRARGRHGGGAEAEEQLKACYEGFRVESDPTRKTETGEDLIRAIFGKDSLAGRRPA